MYNARKPDVSELPTSRQLLNSTLLALAVAAALLVTVVMPAEYGVDPTGLGRMMGLTEMGAIKQQLAEEASEAEQQAEINNLVVQETVTVSPSVTETAKVETELLPEPAVAEAPALRTETVSFTMKPGQAVEFKLAMNKGDQVQYLWKVDKGHLNFDTHADNKEVSYFGYNKGKKVTQDSGTLTAAFDGKHGWFWRNRSKVTVVVSLNVEGEFSETVRVL
ncbi:MAG: transmembrane anchor protein [Endozoicomonas sp.]|uniref:transmembrane anchor protein n=1 Tax=Endozoicomonas sp. TaxID=1892382 RepID=UPI003D9B5D2B